MLHSVHIVLKLFKAKIFYFFFLFQISVCIRDSKLGRTNTNKSSLDFFPEICSQNRVPQGEKGIKRFVSWTPRPVISPACRCVLHGLPWCGNPESFNCDCCCCCRCCCLKKEEKKVLKSSEVFLEVIFVSLAVGMILRFRYFASCVCVCVCVLFVR